MGKLENVVIADPAETAAAEIAGYCAAFSLRVAIANTRQQLLSLTATARPELLVVALELLGPDAQATLAQLRSAHPGVCIVLTYRELAVARFAELCQLGVTDVLPQPVDAAALFQIVWQHFKISTRRHERHPAAIRVVRADGVLLGRTRNISEGGLSMEMGQPVSVGDSLLVDLMLRDDLPVRVRAHVLAVEGELKSLMLARLQFDNVRGGERRRLAEFIAKLAPTGLKAASLRPGDVGFEPGPSPVSSDC